MLSLKRVEQLTLGDIVRKPNGIEDLVLRLHLRREAATLMATGVTVTHETGCWTLPLGRVVDVVVPPEHVPE
jgi:hypothetical protein